MELKGLEYLRRKNLGFYEHEELKVEATLEAKENAHNAFTELKTFVENCLGITQDHKEQLKLPIEEQVIKKEKVEEVVKEEVVKEAVVEEVAEKPKKEKKPKAELKPETRPNKRIKKEVNYDRFNEVHKKVLGTFLDATFPRWRKPEYLGMAVKASEALNGSPFLDNEGEILESFKSSFTEMMKF